MEKVKKLNNPYLPAIIGSIILMILGQILSTGFLSMNNISSILMTTSILTLASVGQAAVIISGDSGLDMSIGAIMSMTALFGPMIAVGSGAASFALMIPATILMGAIVGLLNGIGVQVLKVVPLVMTLIMSNVVNGFSILVTKGQPSVTVSPQLKSISKTLIGPLRILPAVIIILLVLLEVFFLRKSRYGRRLFLAGNNRNAANLCGINSRLVIILAYIFGGAVAGLAGLMLVGYAGTAQMNMANSYTMLSIAAVVIGGTKLTGGKGTFVGGALGSLVLILITNILQALNMAAGLRSLIQGVILLAILMVNSRAPRMRQ
ncbi:monosaccharide ABC transporter membrane protein (CUT2 family) [Muricomes intestini]|uniref:Monosaccharide ABC transporter membrane protein (CUT2 family) n=1 Tax=Muricomes intestini TaxID=1796634 RepID=A0A4R3K4Q7_9FIRM|nr:ABC transporter permease [Muricomes intestini]TCS77746.1 monosaccharide ABC transporter membrane protein (CUT2 family) [Muricomes intestini]